VDLLELEALFGDKRKQVRLSMFREAGNIDIFVEDYREGSITSYLTGIEIHLHPRSCLTGDDLYVLLDLLTSNERVREVLFNNRLFTQLCQAIH
jgi:hypothetical protein